MLKIHTYIHTYIYKRYIKHQSAITLKPDDVDNIDFLVKRAPVKGWNILGSSWTWCIRSLVDEPCEQRLAILAQSHRRGPLVQIVEKGNAGHNEKVSQYTEHHRLRLMGLYSHSPAYNRHVSIRAGSWCNGRRWSSRTSHVFFYIMWMDGYQYGKQASRQRQYDAPDNVLLGKLGSWHSCWCYFDTYLLPKHCSRQNTLSPSWQQYSLLAVASFRRIIRPATLQKLSSFSNHS